MALSVACCPLPVANRLGLKSKPGPLGQASVMFEYLCGFFYLSNIKMAISDP